ncbi:ABC transporter substrate-binding protein [Microvirga sp. VF16]|uniref:ABC transporter substrate-binding protein n=1 Tax=Microvirga sp. VF16 TaxID=2807101 RepID=UPI001FEFE3B7|nr:ABC transporter substrate-binding protein [Microvirga sp. VF16]
MVMEDIQIFDPVLSTSTSSQNHAMAIYDTLFALDANLVPQPQMVGSWGVSEDKKTYTFELRDGLSWHDGTPVTAADCVASIRRWGQTVSKGQLLLERASHISATSGKSFTIALKEPLGLVLDILASPGQPLFMMREQDAILPATEQVTTNIGSGPFKFNAALTRPGARFVYDRNEAYVPRDEPASGYAGGKIVRVKQAIWENIKDPQTALAALQAGEVDFWLQPVADLFSVIESNPNLVLDAMGRNGSDWFARINCLQPPFDNVKMRQALLHLIDQNAFLGLLSPNRTFGRAVTSMFGVGSNYSNDINTEWFKNGGNFEAAKKLIAEAGYANEKVVILDPTDWPEGDLASQLLASVLRKAGINAELAPMTWGELSKRRAKKGPINEGGWSIFITSGTDFTMGDPLGPSAFRLNGEKAWYGWPQDDKYEALRAKWPDVETQEKRMELAREMQRIWWDYVPQVFLCQTTAPSARNKSLVDMINSPAPEVAMWNMRKVST